MLSFIEYKQFHNDLILEAAEANTHSTHIEDLCITNKKKGIAKALGGILFIKKQFGVSNSSKSPAVTIKIDGCVHKDTQVVTKDGIKSISELTNNDYVKCFDTDTQTVHYSNNTMPRTNKDGNKQWIKLTLSNGETIICTEDHPLLDEYCQYHEASDMLGKNLLVLLNTEVSKIKQLTVVKIEKISKQDSWDLTTPYDNFCVQVGNEEIVIHNSPAVICGYISNKFFVASKSLFNKVPKINFTDEDIDKNHSGGLAEKLKLALKYLKPVIPKGKIYQGDFLFDSSSRKSVTINGIDSWAWQPNTIQYSVDKNSKLGQRIGAAKFGIIFHTEYASNGTDVSSIHLKGFGVKESDLIPSKDVWLIDAYHHDMSNITAFSNEELSELTKYESVIKNNQSKIDWSYDDSTKIHLMTFINTYIRDNKMQPDPSIKAKEFHTYIKNKSEAAINSKKSEKGKLTEANKWTSVLEYSTNERSLAALFTVHNAITAMKMILIRKLDSVKNIKTFLVKSNGDIVVTGNEGFVLTKTSASGVKLVDRYEFSRANFSNDYIKGWEH